MPSEAMLAAFRLQAGACDYYGSPLYGRICREALTDLERRGPIWRLVESWEGDPLRGFLALRVLGAVHERVLADEAPDLARFYPSAGGRPEWPHAWEAFRDVVEAQAEHLRPRLEHFPQTNEVRRCAALLGGFLVVSQCFGLPLRLREIGASAGLNLHWDRYRYELSSHRYGDEASPVRIGAEWKGSPAPFRVQPAVESRAGCDLEPRRIDDPEHVRQLESYVWADQPERLEQLRAAVGLARERPVRLDRARAADWLTRELEEVPEGVSRVVYHSAFWLYLSPDEQDTLAGLLETLGTTATRRTPLAWLRHEDTEERPGTIEIRVRLWPPGEEIHLADGHPHGRWVQWVAGT